MTHPARIRAWAKTALADRHILAIMELLEDTRTTLSQWRLHVASYPGWAKAKNRTDEERVAVYIGESYSPGKTPRRVFWMIPQQPEEK